MNSRIMQHATLGHGKCIHYLAPDCGSMSLCGAGLWYGMGTRQYVNSTATLTTETVTCKRCLAMERKREPVKAPSC